VGTICRRESHLLKLALLMLRIFRAAALPSLFGVAIQSPDRAGLPCRIERHASTAAQRNIARTI
jgi:hypothetical protein